MIAANMDKLGVAHAICRGVKPDDGTIGLTMIDDRHSRAATVAAAMSLKKGKYLGDHRNVRTVVTPEFKMTPIPGSKAERIPFNIDGDPFDAAAIHVKVCHRQGERGETERERDRKRKRKRKRKRRRNAHKHKCTHIHTT